jgi:hypothetical protein
MPGPLASSPGLRYVAVTPSDSTQLSFRALWVGGSGTLVVEDPAGTACTFINANGWMPLEGSRVRATGTTATSIVAITG